MKNIFINLIVCTLLLFLCRDVAAQSKSGYKIHGTVADSASQKPLDLITVTLTDADSHVASTQTKNNGGFEFTGLKKKIYSLSIRAVGYLEIKTTINLQTDTNAGVFLLRADVKTLKEVQVRSSKPLIQQKDGKVIYDMQADPESKAKSVLDILPKIPFITVDASGNIQLKGSASFKVFVNGKPSGMMDNNLTNVLRTMPASTILRIEVITVPPAKYDAEGLGGIINIVTIKSTVDGYRGTLSVSEKGPQGGPDLGNSFSIKDGKFGISGYDGGSIYNSPQTNFSTTQQSYGTSASSLTQEGFKHNNSKNGYFGTTVSYELDSLNLLSGEFNLYGNNYNGATHQTSLLANAAGVLQGYTLDNQNRGNGGGGDASLNYQLGFKADKNRLLTFSYRYAGYSSFSTNNVDLSQLVNYPTPNYQQPDNEHTHEHTVQADLVLPVKKVNIELGVKAIFRADESNSQYLALDSVSHQYQPNQALQNQFHYTQNVYGIYNSYQFTLYKWNVSAGARAEETVVDASFLSTSTVAKQNYFNVVPTINISRPLGDGNLGFSFDQRLRRPGINRLNPFVDRSNPNFITTGNPDLKASAFDNLEVNYSTGNGKKLSIFVAVDRIFVSDLDLQVSSFDPATQVTSAIYQNTGKGGAYTFIFNANYNPNHVYGLSINNNATYFMLNGYSGTSLISLYRWMDNLSISNNFRLDKGWNLSANLNYATVSPASLQAVTNAYLGTSFGVNKELVKNKLYIAASVNNPFTRFRNNITTTLGPNFTETNINQTYFRSASLSLTYNFGRLQSEVKKNKKGIDNNDVNDRKGGM
ncbi:outer membrane receptor protein involved in Fe transport [Mucilaginibacter frigoritolerans]|uniref:Outer membrane receptor protein involved in Fe transport n=1 Tax=Mucilaginibacter frigoritolerans TaxID=652788 RepID=A0A562U7J7_9SPHI|nr:outer membrane beta-barrel family protein [Mucilaginibacter frigoritolerans]TWJ01549.1 outer membrane receptor protein involved in Fe transport [Mucilaginibacter frigoritolerans]